MTMKDLSLMALSLISETVEDLSTYDAPVIIAMANILFMECFAINNSIREAKGKEPLPDFEVIASMDDELEFEKELLVGALPYGLAGKIVLDDDMGKSTYFTDMYTIRCNQFMRAKFVPITDFGGGDNEDG